MRYLGLYLEAKATCYYILNSDPRSVSVGIVLKSETLTFAPPSTVESDVPRPPPLLAPYIHQLHLEGISYYGQRFLSPTPSQLYHMLAFAAPLSHNQSADGPSATSTAIRSRSTPRPCPPASSSASSVPLSANNSSSHQGIHRASSRRTAKSSLPPSRSSTEDHRNDPPISRSTDQQTHPNQQPSQTDGQSPCSDASATHPGAAPPH